MSARSSRTLSRTGSFLWPYLCTPRLISEVIHHSSSSTMGNNDGSDVSGMATSGWGSCLAATSHPFLYSQSFFLCVTTVSSDLHASSFAHLTSSSYSAGLSTDSPVPSFTFCMIDQPIGTSWFLSRLPFVTQVRFYPSSPSVQSHLSKGQTLAARARLSRTYSSAEGASATYKTTNLSTYYY